MKIAVLRDRRDVAALAPEWDALAQQDPRDGFFRTFPWYQAWMEHIRPDAEPFVVAARDDAGALIGLAPLCRLRYHDLGLRLKALAWAGREVVSGDFLDFVTAPGTRVQAVSAMLECLRAERGTSLMVMGELIDGGDSYAALERMAERAGYHVRRQEERLCPYIALPDSFDGYLETLSSSTRYHIRRRTRDVEKKGAVLEVHSQPEEVVSRLEVLFRLHEARWRKDHQPGTFGRPGFQKFLRQVVPNLPAGSRCSLYQLVHEGAPVAALLMFYFGESALYYQAGWDPDSPLAGLSPGVVVMAHSIRAAIEERRRYYEFLRGDEAYKSRWTKTHRKTATLLLASNVLGREYLRIARMKDLVKNCLPGRREAAIPASGQYADTQ